MHGSGSLCPQARGVRADQTQTDRPAFEFNSAPRWLHGLEQLSDVFLAFIFLSEGGNSETCLACLHS